MPRIALRAFERTAGFAEGVSRPSTRTCCYVKAMHAWATRLEVLPEAIEYYLWDEANKSAHRSGTFARNNMAWISRETCQRQTSLLPEASRTGPEIQCQIKCQRGQTPPVAARRSQTPQPR